MLGLFIIISVIIVSNEPVNVMVPGINAGEVGWLDDTGTLVTAMKIAGTNRPRNRIPVEYLTGVDDVVLLSNISNGSREGGR